MRIDSEDGFAKGISLTYQKKPNGDRIIGYADTQIVKPRFQRLLQTASFELNNKEAEFLEETIQRFLIL